MTSGTIFASRKLPFRDLLSGIALFIMGAKGKSALQFSRELGVAHTTAFVLCHKLREAMDAQIDRTPLTGRVEIDGALYGGYLKPANKAENRIDRRKKHYATEKRKAAVVLRERGGRTITIVAASEKAAVPEILKLVSEDAILYTDEGTAWSAFNVTHQRRIINHKKEYAVGSISTNLAESFHSRMRRSEIGVHHHFAGVYFDKYASESAWRENHSRMGTAEQYLYLTAAAASHPVSRQWKGYWQRKSEKAKLKEAAEAAKAAGRAQLAA